MRAKVVNVQGLANIIAELSSLVCAFAQKDGKVLRKKVPPGRRDAAPQSAGTHSRRDLCNCILPANPYVISFSLHQVHSDIFFWYLSSYSRSCFIILPAADELRKVLTSHRSVS